MTVSDLDRLHSQLSRFEDMFPGYRMEIVEGNIMMSPVKPHHAKTIWSDPISPSSGAARHLLADGEKKSCPGFGARGPGSPEASITIDAHEKTF